MPDITKCEGGDCHLKYNCYRFISADSMQQAYFVGTPYKDGKCDFFWGTESERILNQLKNILNGNER